MPSSTVRAQSLLLLLAILASAPRARGADDPGRKWAIVIGINGYLDSNIPRLRYAVADARAVAKTLSDSCGYDSDNVLVLADDEPRADHQPLGINLRIKAANWLKLPEEQDTVLVFFSGHGFLDPRGQGYLAPMDCELSNLGLTGVRTDDLRNMLHQCKATQKLLVLDCCHAGGTKGIEKAGQSSEELGKIFKGAEGLVTLASCRKDELSQEWDENKQGLFTYFLTRGLAGAADADGDGIVDNGELYKHVWSKVRVAAQRELNAVQTPVQIIGDDVAGVFALASVVRDPARFRPTVRAESVPPIQAGPLARIGTNSPIIPPLQPPVVSNPSIEPKAVGQRRLFLLCVGISDHANPIKGSPRYAAEDARAFASAWASQAGHLYSNVYTKLLRDREATAANIRDGLQWLGDNAELDDVAIVFIASRGALDTRGEYYLGTHEIDPKRLLATGILLSGFNKLIAKIPCNTLVFIDAYQGAGPDGHSILNQLRDLTSEEIGAILFTSSVPRENSFEDDAWKHGAFAKAILDALADSASDIDHDGKLSITELDLQISKRVRKLTDDQQHPATHKPSTIADYDVYAIGN